jgi:hypothetical protein
MEIRKGQAIIKEWLSSQTFKDALEQRCSGLETAYRTEWSSLQFFWQPQYDHTRTSKVELLMSGGQWLTYIVDRVPRLIRSGGTFTLTTDDPDNKPLPSWKLLGMQWILQIITAMSGDAIGNDMSSDDESSCDWVYDWIPSTVAGCLTRRIKEKGKGGKDEENCHQG